MPEEAVWKVRQASVRPAHDLQVALMLHDAAESYQPCIHIVIQWPCRSAGAAHPCLNTCNPQGTAIRISNVALWATSSINASGSFDHDFTGKSLCESNNAYNFPAQQGLTFVPKTCDSQDLHQGFGHIPEHQPFVRSRQCKQPWQWCGW